jgi:hypothetical protein
MEGDLTELSPNVQSAESGYPSEQWKKKLQGLKDKARHQMSNRDSFSLRPSPQTANSLEKVAGEFLSLDLGREKAGGGFKGHSAKLGKLIINDEGLKMCDLVVAACMGVWWQYYDADA